jgi:hypothetical protein
MGNNPLNYEFYPMGKAIIQGILGGKFRRNQKQLLKKNSTLWLQPNAAKEKLVVAVNK